MDELPSPPADRGAGHDAERAADRSSPPASAQATSESGGPDASVTPAAQLPQLDERALGALRDVGQRWQGTIAALHRQRPELILSLVVPEIVVARRWQRILHNRIAPRLRASLIADEGIVITTVPFHLPA